MPKLHLDWSDGRYYTRLLTDEEAAASEEAGADVVRLEDHVYEAYRRDADRDSIWQAFWRAISNEQSMRRREKELRPLEEADREIARLKSELERVQRSATYFEDEWTRVRRAVHGHSRESREWTCVYPQPGCKLDLLPPQWRERAEEILAKYRTDLADEGMKVQGCCCGHKHERLHDATVLQLRAAGFIVEHDAEADDDDDDDDDAGTASQRERHADHREFSCVYPQPGCAVDALPEEWRERAREILGNYRSDRMEDGLKYQGCCCDYGNHRLLDDAQAQGLRDAGFLVENDTEYDNYEDP